MTAATLHRPTDHPADLSTGHPTEPAAGRSVVLPTQRAPRPAGPPRLRLVPAVPTAAPVAGARQDGHQVGTGQLTRRGRLVVLLVLVVAGVGLMLALTGLVGGAAAGTPAPPATRIVVVEPGQTLWSIAGQVAPGADRRDTIARIVELNGLPSTDVAAGARIAVPAR